MSFTDGDKVAVLVLGVEDREGVPWYRVRLRHRDYRDDRPWSFCDLDVRVPSEVGRAEVGDLRALVLRSVASEAVLAFAGGYSCKVRRADETPPFAIERAGSERRYAGLVQRSEPPAGGALILHMGSGLTCYPELSPSTGVAVEELQDGEWWELVFPELRAVCFEPLP